MKGRKVFKNEWTYDSDEEEGEGGGRDDDDDDDDAEALLDEWGKEEDDDGKGDSPTDYDDLLAVALGHQPAPQSHPQSHGGNQKRFQNQDVDEWGAQYNAMMGDLDELEGLTDSQFDSGAFY